MIKQLSSIKQPQPLARSLSGLIVLATVLSPTTRIFAADQQPSMPVASVPAAPAAKQEPMLAPEEFKRQQDWRAAIAATPRPKKGCFVAQFPAKEWKEVPCVATPPYPQPPAGGEIPELQIGNGNDIAAQAPTGFIASATGSFDSLTNVTSESGQIAAAGPSITDAYTLQINTDQFKTKVCNDAADPSICKGWEQFVFENNNVAHRAYIQYWLIRYNKPCPTGWTNIPDGTDNYCVILNNSSGAVSTTGFVTAANLGQVTLQGSASDAGDSIVLTVGGQAYSRNGDNAVDAAHGWTVAEFNVLGDGGSAVGVGSEADFNTGAEIVTRIKIDYGGTDKPICQATGLTAETNNLSFGPTAPTASPPGPAVLFRESIAGGSATNCAASTAIGDTHLTTLSGLLYDFQASGEFELLQTRSGFLVQNRQVSGAPNWPNASVTSAVAARTGKTEVAVCLEPRSIFIDRKPAELPEGKALILADGTQVRQDGNAYFIRGKTGDWVRATLNPNYIDVKVGLGTWPMEAQGLLANARANPNLLATKEGKVLENPFSFEELYHPYADSWRVSEGDSMLVPCGGQVKPGIPEKPFVTRDLNPDLAVKTREICDKAGPRDGALLEACMLDVAMLGNERAAAIYAKTPAPAKVGTIRQ